MAGVGESAARSDKSEKMNNDDNKSSKHVPLAEHEALKDENEALKEKYETVTSENETLIKALELLETKYALDLEKKQKEAVAAKEDIEKWEKRLGEMEKKAEYAVKYIEDLKLLDETEMDGIDLGSRTPSRNLNVDSNTVPDNGVVIEISDDDEGIQTESDRGDVNSRTELSFKM